MYWAFRTIEKNRSGPQRHKFPPACPKFEPLPKRFFSPNSSKALICLVHLRINRMIRNFLFDRPDFFVFYEGTTAAGITLNNEKFGMLYGNHIKRLIRKRIVVSVTRKGAYVLSKNACYADSETVTGSYTETI